MTTTPTYPIVVFGEVKVGQQYRYGPEMPWTVKDRPTYRAGTWVEVKPDRYVVDTPLDRGMGDLYKVRDTQGGEVYSNVAYFRVSRLGDAKAKEFAEKLAAKLNEEQS